MLSDQPNPGESIFLPISVLGNYVLFYERGLKTVLAMLPLSDDICVLFEGLSKRWGEPTGEQEVATDIKKKTLKVEIYQIGKKMLRCEILRKYLERRCYDVQYSGRVESMRLTLVETEDLLPKVVGWYPLHVLEVN